jgi:hypothetical protein
MKTSMQTLLTETERDAYLSAAHRMEQYGGSFAASIAEAYIRADISNARKLREAFSDLFAVYMVKE